MTSEPPTLPALTSDDRYWAERAAASERHSLADIRAAAERWRGGLLTMTGVVATALAVGTPFVGSVVHSGEARAVIGGAMGGAVVCLGLASWAAMSAAFGYPSEIDDDGASLRDWELTQARTAKGWLTCARWATAFGFVLLLLAGMVGFFGSSDRTTFSSVRLKNGSELCGTLSFREGGSVAVITAEDGSVTSVRLSRVRGIDLSSHCDD
ncbi:hypothetical protein [Nocardioides sp. WS12]|uniref:hypothetical protein n=1 Tax=Nocardioides sp. WS12 TaxID=2486272 RepID=UPI0015F8230A|nr:hypothetical protein [Nocardioides sp. WS12]